MEKAKCVFVAFSRYSASQVQFYYLLLYCYCFITLLLKLFWYVLFFFGINVIFLASIRTCNR